MTSENTSQSGYVSISWGVQEMSSEGLHVDVPQCVTPQYQPFDRVSHLRLLRDLWPILNEAILDFPKAQLA